MHAYHLVPAGVSKGRAVARHMHVRGYEPAQCIAVGDSREDVGTSEAVGTFWLVANALDRDPLLVGDLPRNARVAEASHGAGVYEAVGHGAGRAALTSTAGATRAPDGPSSSATAPAASEATAANT
jgi:hydroxymethylpyrimidine pyrophosphatase-like HAD family hydrolase